MDKMTEEQKRLVEENHNLIYFFITNKMKKSVDEYYDIMAIALCKAAKSYDGEKSKFATYACACMLNEYRIDIRKRNRASVIKESDLLYYENTMVDDECKELTFLDVMQSPINIEHQVVSDIYLRNFWNCLQEREKQVLYLLQSGLTQKEAAEKLGMSQSYLSRIRKGVINKYMKGSE